MLADTIREAVATLARSHFGPVDDDDRLTEDLGLDQLARLELAVLLELALGRRVPDAVVGRARTVRDVVAALEEDD